MANPKLLQKYFQNVNAVRQIGRDFQLSDQEIDRIFHDCFKNLKKAQPPNIRLKCANFLFNILKCCLYAIILILLSYIILNHHQPTLSLVMRNVQDFIYPGLKVLRLVAVPIISTFPSLTELYDESCLVENPYFLVPDMECWPCENVYSVVDLSGFKNLSLYQSGIPYIAKTVQSHVNISTLKNLIRAHNRIFEQDAPRLRSTHPAYKSMNDVDVANFEDIAHISWRINRMSPARILRRLFPKPHIVSEWAGQSPERYILVDGSNALPYQLPDPECSYVFLIQGSGQRTLILRPSKECLGACRPVSVTLHESYVLFYNWWYWRPISVASGHSTVASVQYMGSYC